MPTDLRLSVERIQENCEPALCTVLFMGGAGGSLRAGVTENPVRLTRSVKDALTRVTSGGAPVYVWPGGGITFMVDVTQVPAGAFGYVPTPALVAPIEFTLKLSDYAALGGHMDYVRPLASLKDSGIPPDADAGAALMTRLPQIALLADGKRLHLQDGPIDLIVEAEGSASDMRRAYEAAARRFTGLLDELCAELTELRQRGRSDSAAVSRASSRGGCMRRSRRSPPIISSRRWRRWQAPWPRKSWARCWAPRRWSAPTSTMAATSRCILANGKQFSIGLMDRPDRHGVMRTLVVEADDAARGIATSGRHGRSFSLGIADAVTVLARTASQADAAATIIANAVDLPGHPAIVRCPANELQPDSDLGARLVTRDVGELSYAEIERALEAGAACARKLLAAGIDRGRDLAPAWRDGRGGNKQGCRAGTAPI